jgi:hypothetical protein
VAKNSKTGRNVVVVAIVIALVGVGLGFGLSSGTSPPFADLTPAQVVADANAAADGLGSVHAVVSVKNGTQTQTVTVDSGRTTGDQLVTAGPELAEIVVVGQETYIRGNAEGLAQYFNFPAAVASRIAGHWVSFRPSDVGYRSVTAGVTLDSALKALEPTGSLRFAQPTRIRGTKGLAVKGASSTGDITEYIEARGAHLPLGAVQESGNGKNRTTASIQLSRWGEQVAIKTPPGAIPFSSFTSSKPPTTPTTTKPAG